MHTTVGLITYRNFVFDNNNTEAAGKSKAILE